MGGITLSFILLGIMAVRGMLDRPFTEVAVKMMWASIITSMAKVSGGSASAGSKGASGGTGAVRTGIAGKSAGGAYQKSRSEGAGAFKAARGARHEFNKSKQEMKQGYPDYFRKGTK